MSKRKVGTLKEGYPGASQAAVHGAGLNERGAQPRSGSRLGANSGSDDGGVALDVPPAI